MHERNLLVRMRSIATAHIKRIEKIEVFTDDRKNRDADIGRCEVAYHDIEIGPPQLLNQVERTRAVNRVELHGWIVPENPVQCSGISFDDFRNAVGQTFRIGIARSEARREVTKQ